MYHTLEFQRDLAVDLVLSPRQPLERLHLKKGSRMVAQLRPYVMEWAGGLTEMADLFFADGSSASGIPYEYFRFADN
jgi:hypothetical protein